jgi:F-box-like
LLDVVRYLRIAEEYGRTMTRDSARDLASLARTCRRFHLLAMPTLWREVYLWPDNYEWPYWLSTYPNTGSKRALSHVRDLTLSLYKEPHDNYPTKNDFDDLYAYLSGCLRMLKDTKAIDVLRLFVGLYDSNNYSSECNDVIEAINRIALQIIKRVSKMKLQQLEFHPGRETAHLADMMSIIEQNVDKLGINTSPIADWAPRLQYFTRLKFLDVCRLWPRSLEAEAAFWTAVSQLPNLTIVKVDTVPFPRRLELRFPLITDLQLMLTLDLEPGDWSHTVVTIFKQMPGLEKLMILLGFADAEARAEVRAAQITTIACEKLKDLHLSSPVPKGLISTIARHCPQLTRFSFSEDDINDEDLRQLSLSCPNIEQIRLHQAKTITSLEYFATFQRLEILELYYPTAKFIDKPLLLKLVDSCPKLQQIRVSDWNSSRRRVEDIFFEITAPEDLFAAAAELPSYFVPKISKGQEWTPDGLVEYAVRIDMLREDISQYQQLTKRFGMALVSNFFGPQLISSRHSIF